MLGKSEKGKKWKRKQSEIKLWTSTIQMSQESSRTDPYNPIFGHIKILKQQISFQPFSPKNNSYIILLLQQQQPAVRPAYF